MSNPGLEKITANLEVEESLIFKYRYSEFIIFHFSDTSNISEAGELTQASQHTAKSNIINLEIC